MRIKADIYECSNLLSRFYKESYITWEKPKTFYGSLTSNGNLDTHTIICVLRLAYGRPYPNGKMVGKNGLNCLLLSSESSSVVSHWNNFIVVYFFCPLITGNSSRTRNPNLPITMSKPVHPHVIFAMWRRLRSPTCLSCPTTSQHRRLDSTSVAFAPSACPLHSPCWRQNQCIPM